MRSLRQLRAISRRRRGGSSPRILYHVTDVSAARISCQGIDYRRSGIVYSRKHEYLPRGNYLWPTLTNALRWAERYRLPHIYAVDARGLPLRRDPFWDFVGKRNRNYREFVGPRGGAPRAFYSAEPIPPGRLARLELAG